MFTVQEGSNALEPHLGKKLTACLLGFVFAFWNQELFRVPSILPEVQMFKVVFIDISKRGK